MFGFIISTLNLTLSTLLPTFLTYKALSLPAAQQTAATLHPWLTYWVTNSLVLAFPRILPFDSYIRLGLHIYLLVPGRAENIYQVYVSPWLREHESQIEDMVERVYDQGMKKVTELVRTVRELLIGTVMGDKDAVRRKDLEDEERRKELERQRMGMGGFVQMLLQRWSSESEKVEGNVGRSNGAGGLHGEQTLATKLSDLFSAAAVVGVDKLQNAVSGDKPATHAQNLRSANPVFSSATASAPMNQSVAGLSKSRSEVDFEKIEQEEAPKSAGLGKQQATGSWTSWLWNSKPRPTTETSTSETKATGSAGGHSKVA